MTDKPEAALLPCPFCGGSDLDRYTQCDSDWVGCFDCDCGSPLGTWNRRAEPPRSDAELVEEQDTEAALKRRDEELLEVAERLDVPPGGMIEPSKLAARIRAIVEGK